MGKFKVIHLLQLGFSHLPALGNWATPTDQQWSTVMGSSVSEAFYSG